MIKSYFKNIIYFLNHLTRWQTKSLFILSNFKYKLRRHVLDRWFYTQWSCRIYCSKLKTISNNLNKKRNLYPTKKQIFSNISLQNALSTIANQTRVPTPPVVKHTHARSHTTNALLTTERAYKYLTQLRKRASTKRNSYANVKSTRAHCTSSTHGAQTFPRIHINPPPPPSKRVRVATAHRLRACARPILEETNQPRCTLPSAPN